MPYRVTLILVSIASSIGWINSHAQQHDKTKVLPVEQYSLENGLMQSMTTFAYSDEKGLLWVGSGGGLHYFDGNKFHSFRHIPGKPNTLPDNMVRSMTMIGSQKYLIGSSQAISIFNRITGAFDTVCSPTLSEPVFLGTFNKHAFYWTRDHGFFYIAKWMAHKIYPKWLSNISPPKSFVPTSAFSNDTSLFVAGNEGLCEIIFHRHKSHMALWTPLPGDRQLITSDKEGNLWVISQGTTYRHNGTDKPSYAYRNETEAPSAFLVDSQGFHWIADETDQTIYRFKDGIKETIYLTVKAGRFLDTLKAKITFFQEDKEGNIWIGTDGQGLLVHKPTIFRLDMAKVGFTHAITASFHSIWVGTYKNGLWRLKSDLSRKTKIQHPELNGSTSIQSLWCDSMNRVWAVTGRGLFVLDSDEKENFHFYQKFSQAKIHPSANDTVLISSPHGTWMFHTSSKIRFIGTTSSPYIISTAIDAHGQLWAGNRSYLYRLPKGKSLAHLSQKDTLTKASAISITHLDGHLWVSASGGMQVYDTDGKLSGTISLPAQLASDRPYGLFPDCYKRIWISTDRGIGCFSTQTGKWYIFDMASNLQALEFSSGAWHQEAHGRIYYGGVEGINGFNPSAFPPKRIVAPPFLTKLNISDTAYCSGIPPEHIFLKIDRKKTSISGFVSSSDYQMPDKRKFSFMLRGHDKEWSSPSAEPHFSYNNIPPGQYTLVAKAFDHYKNQSSDVTLLEISIPPPFWKSPLFFLFLFLVTGGGIAYAMKLYQKWRYHKIIRHWKQKDALNRERLRIARDLHDDIGAELSRIVILSRSNSNSGKERLEKISEKTQGLIENLKHIIWAADPRNDKLEDLQAILREYISAFAEKNGWKAHVQQDEDCKDLSLSAVTKRNIFLILKECLHNTWKHAEADTVTLSWICTPTVLKIIYTDNGKGFSDEKIRGGNGLRNIKERATDMGGTIQITGYKENGCQIMLTLPRNTKTP